MTPLKTLKTQSFRSSQTHSFDTHRWWNRWSEESIFTSRNVFSVFPFALLYPLTAPWCWKSICFYLLHCHVNQWIFQIIKLLHLFEILKIVFPLQISFMSLIDVRILNNGKLEPAKASSGWINKAPIVSEATSWSVGPSSNYKQTHAPTQGKYHC